MEEGATQLEQPSSVLTLKADAPVVMPNDPVGWVVETGEVEVYAVSARGRSLLAVVQDGEGFLPVAAGSEIQLHATVTSDVQIRAVPSNSPAFEPVAANWFGRLQALTSEPTTRSEHSVFEIATVWVQACAAAFTQQRSDRDRALVTRLSGARDADEEMVDQSKVALKHIAASLRVPADLAALDKVTGQEDIPPLCRRIGFRAREVQLEEGWHRRDHGPLLVRRAGDVQDPGMLEALVWRGRCYRSMNGARVAGSDVEQYDHRAFAVAAPLPSGVTSFWPLVGYILRTTNRRAGFTAAFAAVVTSLLGVLTPLATVWLLSDIVPSGMVGLLFGVGVALAASALFTTLLGTAQNLAVTRLSGHSAAALDAAVSDRILRLPTGFFKGYAPGDLNQRMGHLEQIRSLIISIAFSTALTAVLSVVYLAVLLSYDAQLAFIAVGLVLVYIIAVVIARILQIGPIREAAELDGRISALTYETLEGVAKLRASAAEERAISRWLTVYAKERDALIRAGKVSVGFSAFSDAYQTLTLIALFASAGALVAAQAPAGIFIGFLVAFGSFQGAFVSLSSSLLELYAVQPLMDRARPILEAEPEVSDNRKDPGKLTGLIEASSLTFSYTPGSAPAVDRVDFKLNAGEHMAVVGASGSGKSTLLRLLLGFEAPQSGSILYDGQELSHLDLTRVRGQIGVVLQASELFAGSILENIRGATSASLEDCLEAAEKAGLSADLQYFAMGVHTPITEGASTLSGGQRQRILIARALAANPKILFFDEATSALDNATQAIVAKTLDDLAVTRITIAHRLSTVRNADKICVMEDGRIIEAGSFQDLMEKGGAFAALAERQLTEGGA